MTLVILAAGMGSRYGGLKQIDPIGPDGEFIIDYSVYDAIQAGFDKVVFIIKKEHYEEFAETIGARVGTKIKTAYAFQEMEALPGGYTVPQDRSKPWGTAHALLCAREAVGSDTFAVINADDFYGRESYEKMASFLRGVRSDAQRPYPFAMCGFVLKNTLSENGHVARGVCEVDSLGRLADIRERTKIQRNNGQVQFFEEEDGWTDVSEDSTVSMNFWGFTPAIFDEIEKRFPAFLDAMKQPLKEEFLLPTVVSGLIAGGVCEVAVLPTMAKWHGVTYHEDKEKVQNFIKSCIENHEYPGGLWK